MNEDAGIVTTHPLNTKERRKLEKKLAKGEYGMCKL
jgi:F0F1-type ATP synthase delta subunit